MSGNFADYLKQTGEVGYVQTTALSVVEVEGLPSARIGEMVVFESGQQGYVSSIKPKTMEVVLLSRKLVTTGSRVARTGNSLAIPVGEYLLGKTINVRGVVNGDAVGTRRVDISPVGIEGRKMIQRQLDTGVALVDLMIPLGMGQRELVIGDRKTGKSYVLWQIMLNQARQNRVCVYAAVGKKTTEILKIGEFFASNNILANTVIVGTAADDSAGEIFLCPYVAMTVAEYFRDQGRDVVVVLDDMSTHAKFYRELSLLSRKFPGRDSYPGDIFHVHSKLLERAGNFLVKKDNEEVETSITCFPVVETVQGDITGYIQTNLMSMTDGHIYFDNELFYKGRRPAINPFISVTRVGRQTQGALAKDLGRTLYELLNTYEKTQSFMKFGAELGENSRQVLAMGDKVLAFFDQPKYSVMPANVQIVMLAMLLAGTWDGRNLDKLMSRYDTEPETKQLIDKMTAGVSKLADMSTLANSNAIVSKLT